MIYNICSDFIECDHYYSSQAVVSTYDDAYIHLMFKYAVLDTHLSCLGQ